MAYQVLARKYRPQNFSDVIGQDHVTRTLKNALGQQRIAHGYIFSGHRGIGKTTIARILAMALNCQGPAEAPATGPQTEPCGVCDSCREIRAGSSVDVIEIDAATNRGIDEIRELRDAARYRPARDRYKIYILDEAHQITDAAFNALLKTLEEPPSHIVFMMATTQPEDIPQTIRSRCQHYSFHAVRFDDIVGQLKAISAQEGIDAEDEAISMVAEAGDGSMRDALSIMDQAIASGEFTDGRIRLTAAQIRGLVGTVSTEVLERFMESVSKGSSVEVLTDLDRLMTEGQSPTHFARQFVRYLRNVLVAKVAGADSEVLQISSDERARVGRTAALFTEEDLTRYLNIMLKTFDELGYKQEQRFHLELGLLKLVHAQRMIPFEQFLSGQSAVGSRQAPTAIRSTGAPTSEARWSGSPAPSAQTERSLTSTNREESPSRPSPFESDRTRKSAPTADSAGSGTNANPFSRTTTPPSSPSPFGRKPESSETPSDSSAGGSPVVSEAQPAKSPFTSPAPATDNRIPATLSPSPFGSSPLRESTTATAVAVLEEPEEPSVSKEDPPDEAFGETAAETAPEDVRNHILQYLVANGQSSLAETLAEGEWTIVNSEVQVKIALGQGAINVVVTPDLKRALTQQLVRFASNGRALKFAVIPGLAAPVKSSAPVPAGSAKSRAADDPLVQYFQQKFGAEIRTVIDQTKS
jgi:DNA polymerase-3 subunit gamma/tau